MKLSSLKPCACCRGPLRSPMCATWYVIRMTQAMVNRQHANEVVGLNTMFGGAFGLAEMMAPAADKAVMILGDDEPKLMTEIHVCFDCLVGKMGMLSSAMELAREDAAAEAEAGGAGEGGG